jgi:membrane glycosyltransferase
MTDISLAGSAPADKLPRRRALFAALVVLTAIALLWLAAATLSSDGFGALDAALLALFAVTLPWTVIGFWNAAIGFLIMRLARDPVAVVFPTAARAPRDLPIHASVAVLVCIRNETPARVLRNLAPMLDGLQHAGVAAQFHVYILSDTTDAAIAADEDVIFAQLAQAWRDRIAVTYRRRTDNVGFKAGNIREFCERFGARHEIAVTLDADSVMPAAAVLRLVRLLQADPRLGIVQALVIGLPTTSAFARIFQFGMRLGMRSWTIGGAWWQGDCGPYWGHNAALRLAPFIAHCQLPELPGGGHVLSHDQVEAVLMRRAGYEVRVLPEEDLGWEENPPTLVEFIRRDLRWCQGNMQYWRFLVMPGLELVSRCQLALAIMMFVGSPAWIGLLLVGTIAAALAPDAFVDPFYGYWLLGVYLSMWFAPKIATVTDVLLRRPLRAAYGGGLRLLASVVSEVVFFLLLSPIQWLSHTLLLLGLPFGLGVGWSAQARHQHTVSLLRAVWRFWPQTLLGLASIGVLAVRNPSAIPVALLIAGGLALAVPLAIISAMPLIGRVMTRIGLGRLPEETAPPETLRALQLTPLIPRNDA